MDTAEPTGAVVVLGRSRVWPAIAIPGAAAVILIVAAVVFGFVSWYGTAAVGAALVLAIARRENAVHADEIGLLITKRGKQERSYAWSEIERMGWRDAGLWGSVLIVHPRGGPYDVPGPNSPTDIARIWRPRRRKSVDPLPGLMQMHRIKTLREP